jgi:DNA-binding transcriptional ArsR family regulator
VSSNESHGRSADRRRARSGSRGRIVPVAPDVIEAAARRLRVVGHPVRLSVLELLAAGEQSVSALSTALGLEHQLVSKHLSELHRCGVVRRRQEGNFAVYSLPDSLTLRAVALVCRGVLDERARLAQLVTKPAADRNRE